MKNPLILERGQRGIILGCAGSGKTVGAMNLILHTPLSPCVIFDTKIDTNERDETTLDKLADERFSQIEIDSLEGLKKIKPKKYPDFIIVRPKLEELNDAEALDEYLKVLYERKNVFVYLDEVFQFHPNAGRAPPGLLACLTRGRSRGITMLYGAQRPAWLSRFCLTEANKWYIYSLNDSRDRAIVAGAGLGKNYAKDAENYGLPKHHFYFYRAGENGHVKYSPFPIPSLHYINRKWV